MKIYESSKVPDGMFTRSQLRKMGLKPVSRHTAYVVFLPHQRRYKLYTLEHARPIDPAAGYSILAADDSEDARRRFDDIRKRVADKRQSTVQH
ncbi:hypothetical protein PCCS19_25830 [Paenibacillus sp. CCS19]|uniref:hypothetical protein n=1 Tax=Paenibacillus sp. CCS19 TaxID=3158387 RepID=UPI00255DA06E|nr:hypothetical protein [Paenibacillus cellulosilyticus]GMK39529.1 hypothetical protein PCCS19_25830 [Paenibacillus cellulosilyticus]